MTITHEPLRYAHDEGHTDVCYSSDGSKFITCGSDGDIRIWSSDESEDPVHNCIGEWALCVQHNGDNLYVSTGSNDIQILSYPSGERNGVLDRFVAPINCIAVNDASKLIALAGEDMEVKLINLELDSTDTNRTTIFNGLSGPCLSVALCPQSKYIAAASGDGKLRIWDLTSKILVKEVSCFAQVNSFANAKSLCRIDFEKKVGKLLAYPQGNSVILLNTHDWSEEASLSSSDVTADYSLVQFSPCGKFLAAASIEGDFAIFCVNSKSLYSSSKHAKSIKITGLKWNPLGNGKIVYTDAEGQLGIMSGCISSTESAPDEEFTEDHEVNFEGFEFEDDEEDSENVISLEKIKKQVLGEESRHASFDEELSNAPTPRPRTPEIPLQRHFMPSSTPEHLNPRYLCWNSVGIIKSYGEFNVEDSDKTIEIEFHDSSFHNSIMLQNYQDYTMGCVGKGAVVVANARQIYVIPLSPDSKEWSLKLEDLSEEIILISSSEKLICFASNKYLIRVCSIFGTQMSAIVIPGPIISINSSDNHLLVAYHCGNIRKGDQCISLQLFTFTGFTFNRTELPSALSPESSVSWIGFTDKSTPAILDSSGILSIFSKQCNSWIPSCDTTKHLKSPSDGFFVTAVFESQLLLAGIKCKGSVYPVFTPRPTVCEVPLAPLFAEPSTEKSMMEMNLFMWSNLNVDNVSKSFTETGLKTFALACKNNLDKRALEFMEMICDPQLLNLSIKYAAKMNKKKLAEKLMELLSNTNEPEEESRAQEFYTPEPKKLTPVFRSSNKKLTLSGLKSAKSRVLKENDNLIQDSQKSVDNSVISESSFDNSAISTQEVPVVEEPKNPFLRNAKRSSVENPLSLTDKSAGVTYSESPKNIMKETPENKRKHPDSDRVKQKEKQRKLDKFMFTARS